MEAHLMAVMAAQPTPEDLTMQAIIETLRNGELSPSELINTLVEHLNLSDAAIRVAIWYLISQNELELSAEQKLRLVHAA
jgi:hypothetical protein